MIAPTETVITFDESGITVRNKFVHEVDQTMVEMLIERLGSDGYTSVSFSREQSGEVRAVSVHGRRDVGFVCCFTVVRDAERYVCEKWLCGDAVEGAQEVELIVFGVATPFPQRWLNRADVVVRTAAAFCTNGEMLGTWETTIES